MPERNPATPFEVTTKAPVPAFKIGSLLPESVTFTSPITMRVTRSLSALTGSVLLARLIAPSGPARVC